jgi:U3 small nucleolar RNA-associated protein 7
MDSLIAKADALRPYKKRKTDAKYRPGSKSEPKSTPTSDHDPTFKSIAHRTSIPKSLRTSSPPPKDALPYSHIPDKKLRAELIRQSTRNARSKALVKEAASLLANGDTGKIEVEEELDRTWKVEQNDIVNAAGQEAAKGRREWSLDGGPYRARYARNGRYVFLNMCRSLIMIALQTLSYCR